MNRLGEGFWLARCLAFGALLFGIGIRPVVRAGIGVEADGDIEFARDAEGLRVFLRQLTLDAAALEAIDAAVARLDSDRFSERYLAAVFLARLPVLPRQRLEAAMQGVPLDKRLRLAQIFKANTPERTDSTILRAMEAVIEGGLTGLLPEVIAALEGRILDPGWDACVGACEITAVAGDLPLLERSIFSETGIVRAGAAAALIRLKGADAVGDLRPLVDDPDDRIKLIAAHYLREQKCHECLKAYAALLMADEFAVRWEALDALRQISGQNFEFFASAEKAKRMGPAQDWMNWVVENGATAELEFTLDGPQELVLFNGEDIEGWKEVSTFFRKPNDLKQAWGIEDGTLICFGGSNGHLRTRAGYQNFVLSLDYRLPGGEGDSGIGLFLTGSDKVLPTCLEVQLLHGHTGDLYPVGGLQANGADGKVIVYRAERIAEPEELKDDWNRMELKVRAGTLEVRVNGEVVNRASGGPAEEARLTLLNQSTRVEFRRIILTPLE